MAKTNGSGEAGDRTEGDAPLIDLNEGTLKKLIARAKRRGVITYDELNEALPSGEMSPDQIEDIQTALSEMGVQIVESDEDAVDPAEGMRMLTEAIALLVSRPALDSAMAGTADRFELDPEGAIAEQERLRKTKLASQDKLMQRASARAAAPETETNETHGD